ISGNVYTYCVTQTTNSCAEDKQEIQALTARAYGILVENEMKDSTAHPRHYGSEDKILSAMKKIRDHAEEAERGDELAKAIDRIEASAYGALAEDELVRLETTSIAYDDPSLEELSTDIDRYFDSSCRGDSENIAARKKDAFNKRFAAAAERIRR